MRTTWQERGYTMGKLGKKQGQKAHNTTGRFFQALQPVKDTKVASEMLNALKHTPLPTANTEKFLLGLSISYRLFQENKETLLKNGEPLRKYTLDYAKKTPPEHSKLVIEKFKELIFKKK